MKNQDDDIIPCLLPITHHGFVIFDCWFEIFVFFWFWREGK